MNRGKERIPSQIAHLVNKTIKNYLEAPEEVRRLVRMTKTVQGRYGKQYVFQLSHGTQQIKLYEPEKYRNDHNTPLRKRVRKIIRLAWEDPVPNITERLRHLFRHYPYHLLQSEPVELRLQNFYFDLKPASGDFCKIYRALDPENPNPSSDQLYHEVEYTPKKKVLFQYEGREEEHYYALNDSTGELSNLLHFLWLEKLPE